MHKFTMTPLELGVLGHLYELYQNHDFPPAKMVHVVGRHITPSGRYLDLESDVGPNLIDGYFDMGGSYIQVPGVINGIMAVVLVSARMLKTLEFTTYGGDTWDGEEDGWKIV